MNTVLIPKGHGRNIVLQRQITPAAAPVQRLYRYFQIALKIDGVADMPAVQGKTPLGLIGLSGNRRCFRAISLRCNQSDNIP